MSHGVLYTPTPSHSISTENLMQSMYWEEYKELIRIYTEEIRKAKNKARSSSGGADGGGAQQR